MTIFPVLGELTHIQIVYFHQEGARDTGRANKKIILRAVVWRILVSVDPENWVGLSQCGGNVDYPLVKYVQLGNHTRPKNMNGKYYLGYSVVSFVVVWLKWQKLVENVDYILLGRQSDHSPEHFVWVFAKEKQVLRLMSWMVMQLRQI